MANNKIKKLYRSSTNKIIFGVCGGLGEYLEVDPLIIRILFVLLTVAGGSGVIIYLFLAILMPKDTEAEGKISASNFSEEAKKRTQELAKDLKEQHGWLDNARNIIGIIVVLVGLNYLISELFGYSIFGAIKWGIIWALVIIIIGFVILTKSNNK
jgi:phage shock protein C